MRVLSASLAVVFLITFLAAPALGAGWFWDLGNGLGFAALAGILYLTMTGRQVPDARAHHRLGQGVLLVSVGHAFWFLLGDAGIAAYLKPGAPAHLWAGVAALLLQGALVTGALLPARWRLPRDHPAFHCWHRVLAVATIVGATWHILGSGLYLRRWYQVALLAGLVAAACWPRLWRWPRTDEPVAGLRLFLLASGGAAIAFAAIRNLPP